MNMDLCSGNNYMKLLYKFWTVENFVCKMWSTFILKFIKLWESYIFFISGFSWDQKEYLPSADAKLGFHCTSSDVKAMNKLSNKF